VLLQKVWAAVVWHDLLQFKTNGICYVYFADEIKSILCELQFQFCDRKMVVYILDRMTKIRSSDFMDLQKK